jgi:hypothetical protein
MERIHRAQMTAEEIAFVERKVHGMEPDFDKVPHLATRLTEKRLTRDAVLNAVRHGLVIEVNSNGRALMRSKSGTCAVISLYDQALVTAWPNNPNDRHKTLRREEYTWNIDVITYVKSQGEKR